MRAEIITIGDELLIGQVVDTNSAWISQRLNECGIEVHQITSVHDDRNHIVQALNEAFTRADLIITTGGLGPTKDDITKHVLCEYFRMKLVESPQVKAHIEQLYASRPEVLNRLTATQWQVPQGATILPNRVGSAPLMVFPMRTKTLVSLPGVPYEMEIGITEQVLPYLRQRFPSLGVVEHRTIMVSGIPESSLAILLSDYEASLPKGLHLAYLPKDGTIRLRLSSYGEVPTQTLEEWIDQLQFIVHNYLIVTDDRPLELHVADALNAHKATLATAESCTGGKLASLLTRHSGSSSFFRGTVVAYSNDVKRDVLGIPEYDLQRFGAVSEPVVRWMAEGVRRITHSDYAIATSGIAGPTGGTKEKPVGTVWIGWATPNGTDAACFQLGKLRDQITDRACQKALIGLLERIR